MNKLILTLAIVAINLLLTFQVSAQKERPKRINVLSQISFINMIQADYSLPIPNGGGMSIDLLTDQSFGLGVQSVIGYYIFPDRLSLGLGLGLDFYKEPDEVILPFYVDLRFYWIKHINSPYIFFDVGTAFRLGENYGRGHGGKIGIGYKFPVSKKMTMTFDIAIDGKQMDLSDDESLLLRGTSFSLGVLF